MSLNETRCKTIISAIDLWKLGFFVEKKALGRVWKAMEKLMLDFFIRNILANLLSLKHLKLEKN